MKLVALTFYPANYGQSLSTRKQLEFSYVVEWESPELVPCFGVYVKRLRGEGFPYAKHSYELRSYRTLSAAFQKMNSI